MKSLALWVLVGLNAVLLLVCVLSFIPENRAMAQVRRPSDYLMIPGEVSVGSLGLVYIIDTGSGQLSAMSLDDANHRLELLRPAIDLNRVFDGGAGIGNPRGR